MGNDQAIRDVRGCSWEQWEDTGEGIDDTGNGKKLVGLADFTNSFDRLWTTTKKDVLSLAWMLFNYCGCWCRKISWFSRLSKDKQETQNKGSRVFLCIYKVIIHICVCVCMRMYVHLCVTCACDYVCLYACVYVCTYVFIRVCACVCILC